MNLWYLNGARYYDPTLRRFITPDTIVQSPYDPQSLNRYAYVRNNPLIYTDEDGHFFWIPVIVGAVMGGTHGNPFNYNNWNSFDVGGALIGGVAGWAGGSAGSWAFGSAGGGVNGLMASGMIGGFAAGSVGGGLTAARYNGNVFEGAMMGGMNGAASGVFTSGFAAMGVTGVWGSAAGSWASSYLMSGFSNPSAAWASAGSAAAGSFLSASLNRFSPLDKSGRVPTKEEFSNKDPRAIAFEKANSSYVAVGESVDRGDLGWNFIALTLGYGYSHVGHTQDGYPTYGRYYKLLEVDISPKPYWNNGKYGLFSNNCATNYGYSHPGSYNANVSYEGSTYYLWRFYK